MADPTEHVALVWWDPDVEQPPSLPASTGWRAHYGPVAAGQPALIATAVDGDEEDDWRSALDGRDQTAAGIYRRRLGGRPGVDLLTGSRPLSLFGCGVDPAHEDGWNHYYDTGHFPGVVRQALYVGGARFELHRVLHGAASVPPYLVVYEVADAAALEVIESGDMPEDTLLEYQRWMARGAAHTRPPFLRLRVVPASQSLSSV
jgi:hypothetical protein